MSHWKPYLDAIRSASYDTPWGKRFVSVDVEGKKVAQRGFLLNLKAETVTDREEEKERFSVLDGLWKYAPIHVVLEGRPGSGKTTALRRLLLEIAQKKDLDKIPIFVPLRDYKSSILELIIDAIAYNYSPRLLGEGLGERSTQTLTEEIKTYLVQGKLLLLFDGINELPSDEARKELEQFHKTYKTTPMIFTTRQLGLGGDLNIDKKLTMLPLTEPQMKEFVKAYLPEKGEEMLKRLGERLQKFGETPLLLLMLCSVFNENDQIPNNLGETFRAFTHIYDTQLKDNVTTQAESKTLWERSLQYLAYQMTRRRDEPVISRREAEDILQEFLEQAKEKDCSQSRAINWLKDLLNYHLLQGSIGDNIEFRHQLIQEYYAGEYLLVEVKRLTDEQLKWEYLNYLKWTEPVALMLGLCDEQELGERVVKLALDVDLQLGARLAGEVKKEFQQQTVGLVSGLELSEPLKIYLLGKTRSDFAISSLSKFINSEKPDIRWTVTRALGEVGSQLAIDELIKILKDQEKYVVIKAIDSLEKINNSTIISKLLPLLDHSSTYVRYKIMDALETFESEDAIPSLIERIDQEQEGDIVLRIGEIITKTLKIDKVSQLKEYLAEKKLQLPEKYKNWEWIYGFPKLKSYGPLYKYYFNTEHKTFETLAQETKDKNPEVRQAAVSCLIDFDIQKTLKIFLESLLDENNEVRMYAQLALRQVGNLEAIPYLFSLCVQKNYIWELDELIETISTIQNRFKFYKYPQYKIKMIEIFISYAWESANGDGKESEDMANQLEQVFKDKGYTIIRDKKDLGYKGNIEEFMQRIGRGKCILIVISDKYLKSENCMFELVEIAKNGDFYDRIFPVVLPDAKIYKAIDRDEYIDYWDHRIEELNEKLKSRSGSFANRQSIFDELNLYDEIRRNIDQLTETLKNMNTLTPTLHTSTAETRNRG